MVTLDISLSLLWWKISFDTRIYTLIESNWLGNIAGLPRPENQEETATSCKLKITVIEKVLAQKLVTTG